MNLPCIDVDGLFEAYLNRWIQGNAARYGGNMDRIEELVPEIYDAFLKAPSEELGGKSPVVFFYEISDPSELVTWLRAYVESSVAIPDLLLDRIVDLGQAAESELLSLIRDANAHRELTMAAGSMLQQMQSTVALDWYVAQIACAESVGELEEMYTESLLDQDESVVQLVLKVLDQASEVGKDLFAEVLSNYPLCPESEALLCERFLKHTENRALFASLLAKAGMTAALPLLYDVAQQTDLNYLDYIEIAHAIEALGGESPAEREFAGDPFYESLKDMG